MFVAGLCVRLNNVDHRSLLQRRFMHNPVGADIIRQLERYRIIYAMNVGGADIIRLKAPLA